MQIKHTYIKEDKPLNLSKIAKTRKTRKKKRNHKKKYNKRR